MDILSLLTNVTNITTVFTSIYVIMIVAVGKCRSPRLDVGYRRGWTPPMNLNLRRSCAIAASLLLNLKNISRPISMAYRSSGSSNESLINNMRNNGLLSDEIAEVRNDKYTIVQLLTYRQVFKRVDRRNYVLDERDAYIDAPQRVLICFSAASLRPYTSTGR